MRSASGQLTAILNSGQPFFLADLLTVTTALGIVYRWTSAEADIVMGGNTYQAVTNAGIIFKRGPTKLRLGLEVDTLDIKLYALSAQPSLLIGGIPFMQAVSNGYLDGAKINLQRAVMSTYTDASPGAVWCFDGVVTMTDASRYEAKLQAASTLYLLDVQYPQHVYQSGCMNTLFDAACGVTKATYTFARTAASGSTTLLLNATDAAASGYYDLGQVVFTSGANTGASRSIRSFVAGSPAQINLYLPLPNTPTIGDAFNLIPGCNKLYSDTNGCPKFANQARYRGCPKIPVPETVR